MVRKNNTIQRAALMKEALQNNNATGVDFAGMNYAQFVSGVAPSFDQREEYEGNLMLAVGQRQEIENADENSATYVTHMRDAIRCHPDYGLPLPELGSRGKTCSTYRYPLNFEIMGGRILIYLHRFGVTA